MSKTAVITGCNRGIGLELTRELVADGYNVIGLCRTPSEKLLALENVKVIEGVDLSAGPGVSNAVESLAGLQIDLLINNAGILRSSSLESFDRSLLEEQFLVNAVAPIELTARLFPQINSGGKVAMVTSRMGSIADNGSGGAYGYRMSKSALNAGCMSLALDLKAREIAVAILHPGWVQTEMTGHTGHIKPDESASLLMQRIRELSLETSGTFWHANGEVLPW